MRHTLKKKQIEEIEENTFHLGPVITFHSLKCQRGRDIKTGKDLSGSAVHFLRILYL